MREYQRTPGCLLRFLREQLDDPGGRGLRPVLALPRASAARVAAVERRGGSRRRCRAPASRWRARRPGPPAWPRRGIELSGRIAAGSAAAEGRALARLSDLGWGDRLAAALATDGEPSPALMSGVVSTLRDWPWESRPEVVVSIESSASPVARRLAGGAGGGGRPAGRMPARFGGSRSGGRSRSCTTAPTSWPTSSALSRCRPTSPRRYAIASSCSSTTSGIRAGRRRGSARLLREAGAAQVLPFALAAAGG